MLSVSDKVLYYILLIQVHIPERRSSNSFVFKLKCQLSSDKTHDVMISKEIKVASYKDICGGERKKVHVGFNPDPLYMWVENNTLASSPPQTYRNNHNSFISHTWEVLEIFFKIHNLQPDWHDCDWVWGWYNKETGGWTGCLGKV